jgi:hypothetical protein
VGNGAISLAGRCRVVRGLRHEVGLLVDILGAALGLGHQNF